VLWIWPYISIGANRALIILSGTLYVPDFLSPNIRYWLSFYPELHAIELFRTSFYPHYPAILLDTFYMTYTSILFVVFGLVLERVTRRIEVKW
jgi:capsular polysaccharide transport system permease protein